MQTFQPWRLACINVVRWPANKALTLAVPQGASNYESGDARCMQAAAGCHDKAWLSTKVLEKSPVYIEHTAKLCPCPSTHTQLGWGKPSWQRPLLCKSSTYPFIPPCLLRDRWSAINMQPENCPQHPGAKGRPQRPAAPFAAPPGLGCSRPSAAPGPLLSEVSTRIGIAINENHRGPPPMAQKRPGVAMGSKSVTRVGPASVQESRKGVQKNPLRRQQLRSPERVHELSSQGPWPSHDSEALSSVCR